jgi:hypothetical protein
MPQDAAGDHQRSGRNHHPAVQILQRRIGPTVGHRYAPEARPAHRARHIRFAFGSISNGQPGWHHPARMTGNARLIVINWYRDRGPPRQPTGRTRRGDAMTDQIFLAAGWPSQDRRSLPRPERL